VKNIKNAMRKKRSHPVVEQFSDEDMEQIKRYGQALSGGVAPFDQEVERHLQKRTREASAAKMYTAQTGGSLGSGATKARR
jgi:hypothetical protein